MSKNLLQQNFYERLNIPRDASFEVIRQAYKDLVRVCHPDAQYFAHAGGEDRTKLDQYYQTIFQLITEAYTTLSDEEQRRAYDRTLRDWNDWEQPAGAEAADKSAPAVAMKSAPKKQSSHRTGTAVRVTLLAEADVEATSRTERELESMPPLKSVGEIIRTQKEAAPAPEVTIDSSNARSRGQRRAEAAPRYRPELIASAAGAVVLLLVGIAVVLL